VKEAMLVKATVRVNRCDFDAAILDIDGVLTDTAGIHAAAWKAVFDAFLRKRTERDGGSFQPFDIAADYLAYVDGRSRYDGVRNFLAARSIVVPEGSEHDPEDADTVRAIGERKTRLFRQALQQEIEPASGAEALLKKLLQVGIGIAVGSSSENCAAILHAAGLDRLVDVRVDGIDAETLGLQGKPDPSLFLEAAAASRLSRLALSCSRTRWPASKPVGGGTSAA
jgi:beta-phosphoglucomutase-like phosphatase (HAD superfamily)